MVFYTVVEAPLFQQRIDQLRNRFSRIDHVHNSITWALSNNPYLGQSLYTEDPLHFVLKTTEFSDTPSFWVLYKVETDKLEVHLISISEATTSAG